MAIMTFSNIKKISIFTSISLIISCFIFDTPKLIFRTGLEFTNEIRTAGINSLKNKISFFAYFTEHIGNLELAENKVYRIKQSNNSNLKLLELLHLGEYEKLINKFIEYKTPHSKDNALIIKTACLQSFLQSKKKNSFCKKNIFNKNFDSADSYLSSLYQRISDNEKQNIDFNSFLSSYIPINNELSNTNFFEKPIKLINSKSSKGIAVEDFNQDGFLDLVVANSYSGAILLENLAGKSFKIRESSLINKISQAYSVVSFDYNNDGLIDILFGCPFNKTRLLENKGNFNFEDVTYKIGNFNTDKTFYGTWHIAFSDVDFDGDIDFFISSWGEPVPFGKGVLAKSFKESALYINQGRDENFIFKDETNKFFKDFSFKNKLFVSSAFLTQGEKLLFALNDFTRNGVRFFSKKKNSAFSLMNPKNLRESPSYLMRFEDINKDGELDLIQSGNGQFKTITDNIKNKNNSTDSSTRVYLKDQSKFEEQINFFDKQTNFTTLGILSEDFNNDGCLDFIFGSGNPEPWFIAPNLFYLGYKSKGVCKAKLSQDKFPWASNLNLLSKFQSLVSADFNNDGLLDVIVSYSGFWEGEKGGVLFLKNNNKIDKNYVKIRLFSKNGNTFGVGAVVTAELTDKAGNAYKIVKEMNNKTGFGSSPFQLIFNIGGSKLKNLSVLWPGKIKKINYKLEIGKSYKLYESTVVEQLVN